jgi:3-oxoadipate enol-lactonase
LRPRVAPRLAATFPEVFRGDGTRLRSARGRALGNDPVSYVACYRMLLELDLTADLAAIRSPPSRWRRMRR